PKRLLAALLTGSVAICGENPVSGSMVRSLPVPLQQVGRDVFVDGNRLLGDLRLTLPNVLIHHRSIYVDLQVQKVDVSPSQTCQLTAAQSRAHVEENQDSLPQKNGRNHFLHLLDGENVGNGHPLSAYAHARTLHRSRDRVFVGELPAYRVIIESAHCVPDLR